jgi:3-oxoacyl-[acyl-carrier protein] reductase
MRAAEGGPHEEEIVSLKGKTAIVTGGSRGIGRAVAEKLAERGAAVVVNYTLSSAAAAEVAQAITKAGGKAIAVQADVSKAADVKRLFAETEKAFGKPAIVVANAGVFAQKAIADSTDEDFDNIFNINARGAFFTLREAARQVQDGGRIVAISTGGTKLFMAGAGAYLGSKGAVEQFVRSLAYELAQRQITVNAVSPGYTETDMLPDQFRDFAAASSPFKRVGTAQEVADVVAFLAGPEAGWVTGQNVQAGGGVV